MLIPALLVEGDDGKLELCCPRVGLWREPPREGDLIRPGSPLGVLEVLGNRIALVAPAGATGIVVEVAGQEFARAPRAYGDLLVVIDTNASASIAGSRPDAADESSAESGLVFRSPSSGRFYSRSSPDKDPFVTAGSRLTVGQTICLLEVMKTFNRITYGGDDGDALPADVEVVSVIPADGDDLNAGDPILELTPA
jgi:acetyl-CoA carboxylase biotin carboxyl carrier protein